MATTAPATASIREPLHRPSSPPPTTKQITIRRPPYTYLHLTLLSSSAAPPEMDILTARTHLTSAVQQYLGLTGTAIPIDFLKVQGRDCWIRVPREDGAAVVGALGQWVGSGDGGVGWRVGARGEWLGEVKGGGGEGLFVP